MYPTKIGVGPLRACVLITAALTLLTPFSAPRVSVAANGPTQSCAWPVAFSVATANVSAPDSNAAYWLQSFVVESNLWIVLRGRYPDARYASLSVYDSATHAFTRHGVYSALADFQITPDRGSYNPWRRRLPPGGHFTLTLRTDVAPHEANTLPLAPAGTPNGRMGYLVYRIYLPAGKVSAVPLPALTFRQGTTSRTVLPCRHPSAPPVIAPSPTTTPGPSSSATPLPSPRPARTTPAPKQPQFFRPAPQAATNIFPDADDAPLVTLVVPPGPTDVVVVTARAPRAPTGNHPVPWPAPREDLRYWSLCTYVEIVGLPLVANRLPNGKTDYGCADNDATRVNAAGYYFYVIGRETQRTAIERIPHVTFLPLSATTPAAPHVLYLRNKLATPTFAYSVQHVTQYGDPAAAAAATGPYYPRAAVCPLRTLVARGPQACLAHP